MSNQFLKLRRSAVPGKRPDTGSLDLGEIALNTHDGLAFMKKSVGGNEQIIVIGDATGSFTGSFNGEFTGSLLGTASWAINAVTASTADDFFVRGNITGSNALITGTITAQKLVVQTISSSIIYSSGSNIFGDELTDTQQFTGSVTVTGSLALNGDPVVTEIPYNAFSSSIQLRATKLEATASILTAASASLAIDSGSNSIRLTNLEATSSIVSASYASASGSLSIRVTNLEATSSIVSASYASASGSLSTRVTNLEATSSIVSASYASASGSLSTRVTNLEATSSIVSASYASASGSLSTRVTTLEQASASFAQDSGSNSIRLTNLETTASVLTVASASFAIVSASYAELSGSFRTGSYTGSFFGTAELVDSELSGSTQITGSLGVTGSVSISGSLGSIFSANVDTIIFSGSLYQSGSIQLTGSLDVLGGITGSLFGTASWAVSASHAPTALSSSYAISSSHAIQADTASSADNFFVRQDVTASNALIYGTLTAQTIHAQFITASTEFITGSTKFGTQLTDTHQFTGSVTVTGSLSLNDDPVVTYIPYNTFSSSIQSRVVVLENASASFAQDSGSNSIRLTNLESTSSIVSASYASASGSLSIRVTNLESTSSIVSASYASASGSLSTRVTNLESTASVLTTASASFAIVSASYASASGSLSTRVTTLEQASASFAQDSGSNSIRLTNLETTASVLTSASASFAQDSGSNSIRLTNLETTASVLTVASASFAVVSASYAELSGSFRTGSYTGSFIGFGDLTGSLFGTASWALNAITASHAPTALTASHAITADTASSADNFFVRQDITASNALIYGTLVAQTVHAQFITASTEFITGSTKFGTQLTDTHQFTGSVTITGSLSLNNDPVVTQGPYNIFSQSIQLRATNLEATASILTAASASFAVVSASYASASGSLSTRVTTLENASASFASDSGSNSIRLTNLESTASVLTSASASLAQDSGSNSIRLTNLESTASILTTASASFAVVSASYASASGSLSIRVTDLESTASILTVASASFAIVSSSYASASGSLSTRVTTLENASASFAQDSGSNSIRLTNLESTASVLTTASASFALVSASYAELSGSFRTGSYTGSFTGVGFLTGSLYGTASWAVSASHAPTALTSSHAITASLALTASTADNFFVRQDITASNALIYGTLVAQTIHAQFITASTEFITGSTKFGTQLTDTHQFTGSVTITGSLSVNNSPVITDSTFTPFSSSVSTRLVTLENASASFASDSGSNSIRLTNLESTASVLTTASASFATVSASFSSTSQSISNRVTIIEGNYATTGSNIFVGNQTVTGSLFTSGSNTLVGSTTLTGSLNITGSTVQIGNNTLLGNTTLSGSIIISGSNGPGSTTASVEIYGDIRQTGYHRFDPVTTNIDTSISASYIFVSGSTNDLYFSQNGSGYSNVTRLRWLEGNLYTGLLNGGLITSQSSTTYQVGSGSGIIVNLNASLNDNPYPTTTYVNWPNLTGNINQFSASYDQTFIAISSTGTLVSQSTAFLDGQVDTQIPVGSVLHQNNSTINGTVTEPSLAYGWKQRSNIFISAFGPLKLSGFNLAVSGSSTGSLVVGSGTAFLDGGNYQTDPNNPSYVTATGTSTSRIFRYYESGSDWIYDTNGGVGYGAIDPSKYSNNGTLTSVGAGNWSIQRVFFFPTSPLSPKPIVVYYGNAVYPTEAEAIANVPFEAFTEAPSTAATAIYLGAIVISGNGLFTSPATFTIYPGGLFRQVGGSGGGGSIVTQTLAGLSDVNVSGPTNYQALVYDTNQLKWINASFVSASISGNAATATSASFSSTASFALNVPATASYALQALSSSFATTASYALNVPDTASYAIQALSSSYALTASYALNAGAGISSISIADEGVLIGTASYFDFIGANVSASVSNNTASITIIGGGGAAQTFTQTTPSTLWTVNHNFNSQTPLVQVYNISHSQIIPSAISASSTNTIDIYFATQETGYAVISTGGITVTGSNATLVQSVAATTWSFYHNLNETYPVFTIFDENDDVIIPLRIHADNAYSASIYFSSPRSGKAVAANCGLSGSTFESASFATTASFAFNALTSSYIIQAVSASYALSSSYAVSASNAISSSYAITSSYSLTASYAENIVISGSISNLDYIDFDTSVAYTLAEGRLGWDSGEGTLQLGLEGGNVTYALGEQIYQYVYNAEATTMTKGQVVYVSGSQGNKIAVKLANDSGDPSSAGTLGLVAETIASGGNGWVITEGPLRKLNTIGLTAGKLLFLGSTPGTYTETPPTAPSHSVRLGYVERISATVGSIYVKIDNGYEIGELHDVVDNTTTGSYGDLFVKSGSVWISSKQLTGSYGLTGSLQATSFTGSLQGTSSWASNAVTASFALTASYLNPVTNDYIVLTQVSQSLNYVDDAAAASGGVPLGGLYRNGNFIMIRIS